jgi:hypothetical protein
MAAAHSPHGRVNLGSIRKPSTADQVAPVRTVSTHAERVTTTRTTTTTRTLPTRGSVLPDLTYAHRAACRAYDAAERGVRAAWEAMPTTGPRTARDALGYRASHGYAPLHPAWQALDDARRAVTSTEQYDAHGEATTTTTRRERVTTTTYDAPRAMRHVEEDALHVTQERAARYAGEEYRGGSSAPVSAQADTFGHAPRAASNTGQATTPGQALPSGAVPVSPRKRARTGSTGPTVTAW